MTKEDFLFLLGDEPETDSAFVDSFLYKEGSDYGRLIANWVFDDENPGALHDTINNWQATATGVINFSSAGACIDARNKAITFPSEINLSEMNILIRIGEITPGTLGNANYFFIFNGSLGICYQNGLGYWAFWNGTSWVNMGIENDPKYFENSILRIEVTNGTHWNVYKNDVLIANTTMNQAPSWQMYKLGDSSNGFATMYIKGVQFYEVV